MGQPDSILKCKTCDTPVNSHKTIPSSPTPHLCRTIQTLDESEVLILRKTLRDANSDLHGLHCDIARVQAILDKLRLERESLCKFTIEHNAFLAPIRRLPMEILIKIFMHCMDYSRSTSNPQLAPSLISRVCKGWRQVALSTQELWSSITVTHYQPSSAKVKLWISRASSAPLSIRLYPINPQTLREAKIEPVIAVLVQHCDRWRHLDLRIGDTMVSCLSPIKHHLPWLESLRIRIPTHPLDVFEVALRLHNLVLGPGLLYPGFKVPWHQLTHLDAHVTDITQCLETLQLTPNLARCTLRNESMLGSSTILQHIPTLTFPHLHLFNMWCIHPDEIFRHLQLPVIHTLRIVYRDERWKKYKNLKWFSRQPFMTFLSSHTLCKLALGILDQPEDSGHIAHCLRATPSLKELSLRGSGSWVTADFLCLLTRQANIDELVPGLEILEISDYRIPCYHSTSMIESRWHIGEGNDDTRARLKRLRFEMSWTEDWLVDAEILNRLRKCQQEGMVISIIDIVDDNNDLLDIPYTSPVT